MEERLACVVRFKWRRDESPSPPQQQKKDQAAADKGHGIIGLIGLDEPLLHEQPPRRMIRDRCPTLNLSPHLDRSVLGKHDSAFRTVQCSSLLLELTLGTKNRVVAGDAIPHPTKEGEIGQG